MKVRVISALIGLLTCAGCATAAELQIVAPIQRLDYHTIEQSKRSEADGATTASSSVKEESGVWLSRLVYMPDKLNGLTLRAIEVLFCPATESDYSKCRVGVAWAADTHPMGPTQLGR